MKLVGLVLCLACASGCKSKPAVDSCRQAFDHAAKLATSAIPADADPAMMQGLRTTIEANARDGAAHCRADHWPARATTCLAQAATTDELTACFAWLTPAQRAAMQPKPRAPAAGGSAVVGSAAPAGSSAAP